MPTFIYNGRCQSITNKFNYYLCITNTFTKTKPSSSTDEFNLTPGGFKLSYHGDEGNLFTTLMPSSVQFGMIAGTAQKESYLNSVINGGTSTWYVIIWKDDVLFWWGYLNAQTMSVNREYKPTYNFEAFDKLTLCGAQSFWDYQPAGQVAPFNSLFGMGWRRNVDPTTTSQIPQMGWQIDPTLQRYTTLIGMVYSCLFDTDMLNTGLQTLNVVNWDKQISTDVAGVHACLNNWHFLGIDDIFYVDPAQFLYVITQQQIEDNRKDVNIAQLLNDICLLFRCRIFQYNGEYYLMQWEAYQGDLTAGQMRAFKYNNAVRSNWPSGDLIFPDPLSTTVLSSSDFLQNIDYPRTDPELLPGTSITYNQSADNCKLTISTASRRPGETIELKKGVNYSTVYNGPFSNFTESVRNNVVKSIDLPYQSLILVGTSVGVQTSSRRYGAGGYKLASPPEHLIDTLSEFSNGVRRNLNAKLHGDYNFFKAVELDSVTYINTSYNLEAEMEMHTISAAEFSSSETDLSEVVKLTRYKEVLPTQGPSDGGTGTKPPNG